MIISASRRTDIPAYYSDWLLQRINERCVYVRNPRNRTQISAINLSPDAVDCIVFWTKNGAPLLDKLHLLQEYAFYFQFTLTPYDNDIERNLPDKTKILTTFRQLSERIGPQKVIWRYDPVLCNAKYTIDYHVDNFYQLAGALKGYTETVTFSFIDFYKKIYDSLKAAGIAEITDEEKKSIAGHFSQIAGEHNLRIEACAEDIDLSKHHIARAKCIDDGLITKITGRAATAEKDKNQRRACGCVKSIDIGSYNSCSTACIYCYANPRPPPAHPLQQPLFT